MPNPRFIQQAQRWKNDEIPSEKTVPDVPQQQDPVASVVNPFPDSVESSSILKYDGFGGEAIARANELFKGTRAEIPVKRRGEVENMYILKRLALTTAIHNNASLRDQDIWPITPLQSELLLREGNLPKPKKYWEDLGLLLYDTSGTNAREAQALHDSIREHRRELGLSDRDLDARLLVVNAGLEENESMQYGVKPVVLLGTTEVYVHDTLQKTGENHKFEYGLDRGMAHVADLGSGTRTLYMPAENQGIGLRVLCRNGGLNLNARNRGLVYDGADGRVNLAPQGRTKK